MSDQIQPPQFPAISHHRADFDAAPPHSVGGYALEDLHHHFSDDLVPDNFPDTAVDPPYLADQTLWHEYPQAETGVAAEDCAVQGNISAGHATNLAYDWEFCSDVDDLIGRPAISLHPCDLNNFAKLCTALKIFLANELTPSAVSKGDQLLREYCLELLEVRHAFPPQPSFTLSCSLRDFSYMGRA